MIRIVAPFKVLTLDAMGTIIRLKESPADVYARFAHEKFGITVDKARLSEEYKYNAVFKFMEKSEPCYSFNCGGAERWWRKVITMVLCKYLDCSDSEVNELADSLFSYYATKEPWTITEPDLIKSLYEFRRKSNIKVAIVSNFDWRLRDILSSLDFPPVDAWFLSGEIGIAKPDAEIFHRVADHFQIVDPGEILHIGDDIERDYHVPKALGMQAIVYAPDIKMRQHETVPKEDSIQSISRFFTSL